MLKKYKWKASTWQFEESEAPKDAIELETKVPPEEPAEEPNEEPTKVVKKK